MKTWATTTKADLEPISGPRVFGHARWRKDWVIVSNELALTASVRDVVNVVFGYARWRKDWVKVSSELVQDRRAWSASVRDVVNLIGDGTGNSQKNCFTSSTVIAVYLQIHCY